MTNFPNIVFIILKYTYVQEDIHVHYHMIYKITCQILMESCFNMLLHCTSLAESQKGINAV